MGSLQGWVLERLCLLGRHSAGLTCAPYRVESHQEANTGELSEAVLSAA